MQLWASSWSGLSFFDWVLAHMPVQARSPNTKGIYQKVLALLLTSLTGGTRFSHMSWRGYGLEALKACFSGGMVTPDGQCANALFGQVSAG